MLDFFDFDDDFEIEDLSWIGGICGLAEEEYEERRRRLEEGFIEDEDDEFPYPL